MPTTVTITEGDTLFPLNTIIMFGTDPLNLADFDDVLFRMTTQSPPYTVICDDLDTVTVQPTQAFTANATTNLLTKKAHGVKPGNQVILATSGTLPGGLTASVPYFAVEIGANSFKVSETENGAPIDITDTGSGAHTFCIVGSAQFDFLPIHVASAGMYTAHFIVEDGGERQTIPYDGATLTIQIVPDNRS